MKLYPKFDFRYNARGFDLNRNFPDYFKQNNKRSQPETEAVKEWLSKIQFVLSGNIHGGALVGSYPFDNTPNSIFSSVLSSPSLTPDDDTFKHLAATYSLNHGRMYLGDPCKVLNKRNFVSLSLTQNLSYLHMRAMREIFYDTNIYLFSNDQLSL